MATGKVQGITIKFEGDATSLDRALRDVKNASKDTDKELRQVNNALKFNPGNTELLAQKQALLQRKVNDTVMSLDKLKDLQEQFDAKGISKTSDEYMALRRAIIETESKGETFERQMKDAAEATKDSGEAAEEASEKMEKAGKGYTVFRNICANLVTEGINLVTNALKNQMGAAVERVDTLHAYERTMKNLGYSEEQVADATKQLTDGIQGLPTTLPSIVSMQQQYAALTGDMDKATDLALALNDATLASGKGGEEAARGAEHWYKMLAKGKPEMENWNELQAIMPAQMDQLTKSIMGADSKSQDLYKAWQEGTVTTEQIMDALIQLDKQGGKGITSFQTQAHDAAKGIGTSMENVKTAITNGLAEAIEEIGYDDIVDMIEGLKNGIKSFFKAFAKVVKFIIHNLDVIIPLLKTLGAVMATVFVAKKIMSVKKGLDALTASLQKTVIGTKALALAQKAMPLVAIASGIAAVVTAMLAWDRATHQEHYALLEMKKATEEMQASMKESATAATVEGANMTALKDEYNSLIDANGRVKKGYEERASVILDELSTAMGMERNDIEQLISSNGRLSDSIDLVIAKKKAEAFLESNAEAYQEAQEGVARAIDMQAEAQAKLNAATPEQERLLALYNQLIESGQYAQAQINATQWGITGLVEAQETIADTDETIKAFDLTIQQHEIITQAAATNNAAAINESLAVVQQGYGDLTQMSSAELQKLVIDMQGKINATAAMAKSDPTVAAMRQNYIAIQNAARRELGKVPAAAKTTANQTKANLTIDTTTIGGNWAQGLINGINGKDGVLRQAALAVADNVKNTLKAAWGIKSPSRVAAEIGGYFGEGLAKGIIREIPTVVKASEALSNAAVVGISPQAAQVANSVPMSVTPTTLSGQLNGVADSIVSGMSTLQAASGGNVPQTIVLETYLYPSGPKMGEQIVKAYDTYKPRVG